jgi:ketosteroid isomerase-like protein
MFRATSIAFAVLLATLSCTASPDQPGRSEAELTIQLLVNAIATADTAVMLEIFWPEATYDDFASQQTHQGIQEIVPYLTAVHGWGDDVYMNLARVHTSSTGAVGEWVFSAIQARPIADRFPVASGNEVVLNGVTIIEMEGGRIMRAADYVDGVPLILQLGGSIELPGGGVWEQGADGR